MPTDQQTAIRQAATDNVSVCDDFYYHDSLALAEIVALELNHLEWLENQEHPIWTICGEVANEADIQAGYVKAPDWTEDHT